jgi:hypothetical protein
MNQPRRLPLVLTLLGLFVSLQFPLHPASPGLTTAKAEPWFHVKVVESGEDAETVRVNVPLSLVEAMIPLMDHTGDGEDEAIEVNGSERHHHGVTIDNHDISPAEMRAILEAFRQAEDGEYVAVDGVDEKVRVSKSGGYFLIDVDDRGEEHEQVKVRMRMDVLDALLSGAKDELNFQAAAKSLRNYAGEDLVTVISDDETVRIWIDDKKTTD